MNTLLPLATPAWCLLACKLVAGNDPLALLHTCAAARITIATDTSSLPACPTASPLPPHCLPTASPLPPHCLPPALPLTPQVDLGALPTSLEFLSLKYAYLPCPVFHARMRKLQTLALRHCYLACFSHFQASGGGRKCC